MSDTKSEPNALPARQRAVQVLSLLKTLSPEHNGQLAIGSFDPTDPANLQKAVEADLPADYDRTELEGQIITCQHWFARYAENIASEGEEPRPGVRVTIWTPDGERFTFAGVIAVKCWERIVSLIGPGPYDPPLRLTVQSFQLKNGRHTYGVVPVSGPKEAKVL